jgi:hypothetical protein
MQVDSKAASRIAVPRWTSEPERTSTLPGHLNPAKLTPCPGMSLLMSPFPVEGTATAGPARGTSRSLSSRKCEVPPRLRHTARARTTFFKHYLESNWARDSLRCSSSNLQLGLRFTRDLREMLTHRGRPSSNKCFRRIYHLYGPELKKPLSTGVGLRFRTLPLGWLPTLVHPGRRSKFRESLDPDIREARKNRRQIVAHRDL